MYAEDDAEDDADDAEENVVAVGGPRGSTASVENNEVALPTGISPSCRFGNTVSNIGNSRAFVVTASVVVKTGMISVKGVRRASVEVHINNSAAIVCQSRLIVPGIVETMTDWVAKGGSSKSHNAILMKYPDAHVLSPQSRVKPVQN